MCLEGVIWACLFKDSVPIGHGSVPGHCYCCCPQVHPGKWSSSKTEPDGRVGTIERDGGECLGRYVAFIQQTLRGHMTDEVCTTNDTETMGNYLQFKD